MEGILWVLFTLACVVICGLVLLQEGKGGGLGEAFGGAGAQTFGVKAQGVAKVTGYLIGGLVLTAIVITKMRSGDSGVVGTLDSDPPASTAPIDAETAPAGDADAGAPADAGAGTPAGDADAGAPADGTSEPQDG
ncbi:MAG: preprotein translocase subunit SecG [Planctomycetota bacterium]|nr:MAG: preprotein translocase subunit SecG [Planctomycetota bacterium]